MTSAIVKWFNAKKGYGFLVVDGIDQDVFVHYSVIEGEGFRTLSQGERVDVDVGDDGKGPRARKVFHTDQPAEPSPASDPESVSAP
jgi:CspA family cold shock protein